MTILRPSSDLCCFFPILAPPSLSRASHRLTRINVQINMLQAERYFAMRTADAVCTRRSWGLAAGVTKMPRSWAVNAPGSNCDHTGPSSAEDPAATVLALAVPLRECRMVTFTAAMSCNCPTIAPTAPAFGLLL